MKHFSGFPDRFDFMALPKPFISQVLPLIDDLAELKITILFFKDLYEKKGFPQFVTMAEILSDNGVNLSIGEGEQALRRVVDRGTVIQLDAGNNSKVYFLNDERNRQIVEQVSCGVMALPEIEVEKQVVSLPPPIPDIFSLYEQNIGMLTPIIAEELKEALRIYPDAWINEAIGEATKHNKRNWRYISKILDNWANQGRNDGTYKRDIEKSPDKYVQGKYGRFVQR